MTNEPSKSELHEYAGGWMTERKGTGTPGFLKLAYPVIALACMAYMFLYMNGEIHHSTRGQYVQQLNAVTGGANSFMYIIAAMIAVYAIILVVFVLGKHKEEK